MTKRRMNTPLFLVISAFLSLSLPAFGQNVSSNQAPVDRRQKFFLGKSTIRGVVKYSDTGNPVRRALVSLQDNSTGDVLTEVTTDRQGRFSIAKVTAGSYLLGVNAVNLIAPHFTRRGELSFLNQLKLVEAERLVTAIDVDGTRDVDVEIQAVRAGAITGKVVDDENEPLRGARISLLQRVGGKLYPVESTWGSHAERKVETDPDGIYRVPGLRAGDYVVRVTEGDLKATSDQVAEGAYAKGSFMVTYSPGATNTQDAAVVTVVEGKETAGVDIRMPNRLSHRISGTLTFGVDDRPAGWTEVKLYRVDESGFRDIMSESDRSIADGTWSIEGVPDGEYQIEISDAMPTRDGHGNSYIAAKPVPVKVAGADVVGLRIRMVAAASISGSILSDGKPLLEQDSIRPTVRAIAQTSAKSDRIGQWDFGERRGKFLINGVPSGTYWLGVYDFDPELYYVKAVTHNGVDLMRSPLVVKDAASLQNVRIELTANVPSIEGEVSGPLNKQRVALNKVVVVFAPANEMMSRFGDGMRILKADAKGRFSFRGAPGEYFVAAFTHDQIRRQPSLVTEGYFKLNGSKLQQFKLSEGEKPKRLSVTIATP
jgi:hypothetical protein